MFKKYSEDLRDIAEKCEDSSNYDSASQKSLRDDTFSREIMAIWEQSDARKSLALDAEEDMPEIRRSKELY